MTKTNSADNPQDSSECAIHPTDFYCPWCEEQITHECGYDHAHAHMDKGPYAVTVMEAFR